MHRVIRGVSERSPQVLADDGDGDEGDVALAQQPAHESFGAEPQVPDTAATPVASPHPTAFP